MVLKCKEKGINYRKYMENCHHALISGLVKNTDIRYLPTTLDPPPEPIVIAGNRNLSPIPHRLLIMLNPLKKIKKKTQNLQFGTAVKTTHLQFIRANLRKKRKNNKSSDSADLKMETPQREYNARNTRTNTMQGIQELLKLYGSFYNTIKQGIFFVIMC